MEAVGREAAVREEGGCVCDGFCRLVGVGWTLIHTHKHTYVHTQKQKQTYTNTHNEKPHPESNHTPSHAEGGTYLVCKCTIVGKMRTLSARAPSSRDPNTRNQGFRYIMHTNTDPSPM